MHKCILNGLVQSKNNYLGSYSVVHKGFLSCEPPPPHTHTHTHTHTLRNCLKRLSYGSNIDTICLLNDMR